MQKLIFRPKNSQNYCKKWICGKKLDLENILGIFFLDNFSHLLYCWPGPTAKSVHLANFSSETFVSFLTSMSTFALLIQLLYFNNSAKFPSFDLTFIVGFLAPTRFFWALKKVMSLFEGLPSSPPCFPQRYFGPKVFFFWEKFAKKIQNIFSRSIFAPWIHFAQSFCQILGWKNHFRIFKIFRPKAFFEHLGPCKN